MISESPLTRSARLRYDKHTALGVNDAQRMENSIAGIVGKRFALSTA
jgi:hypothetical protein